VGGPQARKLARQARPRPPDDAMSRACVICGASLAGARRHALVCSGKCRAEASRLRWILSGAEADGCRTLPELGWQRRKRTGAARGSRMEPSKQVGPRAANADPVTHRRVHSDE
jgi:hypothetical protein